MRKILSTLCGRKKGGKGGEGGKERRGDMKIEYMPDFRIISHSEHMPFYYTVCFEFLEQLAREASLPLSVLAL